MEKESIFNKINNLASQEASQAVVSKEQVIEEVRKEIEKEKARKEEILALKENFDKNASELKKMGAEYKEALNTLLPVFENEEQKALLDKQGIKNIVGLQKKYPETAEAKNLEDAEKAIQEKINTLKDLKTEIKTLLGLENREDVKSVSKLSAHLGWAADGADRAIFTLSADTPEGRESWPIQYPTGAFHKETEFEKLIKKEKEPKLRELYHKIGDLIDSMDIESMNEYNNKHPEDLLRFEAGYKEGRHIMSRSSVMIEDNTISFYYGSGYTHIKIDMRQSPNGFWNITRPNEVKALLPGEYLKIFNKKLSGIDQYTTNFVSNF